MSMSVQHVDFWRRYLQIEHETLMTNIELYATRLIPRADIEDPAEHHEADAGNPARPESPRVAHCFLWPSRSSSASPSSLH